MGLRIVAWAMRLALGSVAAFWGIVAVYTFLEGKPAEAVAYLGCMWLIVLPMDLPAYADKAQIHLNQYGVIR